MTRSLVCGILTAHISYTQLKGDNIDMSEDKKNPEAEVKDKEEIKEEIKEEVDKPEVPKIEAAKPEVGDGKGKKRKKINLMSLKEVEEKLKSVKDKMGNLKSRYAKQLFKQKDILN